MRFVAPLVIALGIAIATFAGTACSYDWTYSEDDGGSSGSSGKTKEDGGTEEGDADKTPPTGECTLSKPCDKGICVFGGNKCSGVGQCLAECSEASVCTCAGIRMSGCAAANEGKSIDESGASCPPPVKEYFDCYGTTCVASMQFCQAKGGVGQCVDYQTGCTRDCKCAELPQSPCSCSIDAKGNVIIKCD